MSVSEIFQPLTITINNTSTTQLCLRLSIVAGICFGTWPYFNGKASFSPIHSPLTFGLFQAVSLLIITILIFEKSKDLNWTSITLASCIAFSIVGYCKVRWGTWWTIPSMNWVPTIIAGFIAAVGLICLSFISHNSYHNGTFGVYLGVISAISIATTLFIHTLFNQGRISTSLFVGFALIASGAALLAVNLKPTT